MTNTELLNFHFVNRTTERKTANEFLSKGNSSKILVVTGKNYAGRNYFIKELENENENLTFLYFDFEKISGTNALKYITDTLYNYNHDKFFKFIKKNYRKILKSSGDIIKSIFIINGREDIATVIGYLSDMGCQFLNTDDCQEASVNVIGKYIKEISKYENLVIVFKNLTSCDNYSIDYIFNIIKIINNFQDENIRIIASLDDDKLNGDITFDEKLDKINYIPIIIEKFSDSKYFIDILNNIFNITYKDRNYLEHIFEVCQGYPGELKRLISKAYRLSHPTFETKPKADLDIKLIDESIDKCYNIPKLSPYQDVIILLMLFTELEFTYDELIDVLIFIYQKCHFHISKELIEKQVESLLYNEDILEIKNLDHPIITLNGEINKELYIAKYKKHRSFRMISRYFYEYILQHKESFSDKKNKFECDLAFHSWNSEAPNWLAINYSVAESFYDNQEFSIAENIFLRICNSKEHLDITQLFTIIKCLYEVGNYKWAYKIIKNKDDCCSLKNNYNYMILKIKILNINMYKIEAVKLIDKMIDSNIYKYNECELLDMKQRILSNIKGYRKNSKLIFDELLEKYESHEIDYDEFLISSMEYYRGDLVQKNFEKLEEKYQQNNNQIMLGELLTNKGFDLFWQGKIDEAETTFDNSIKKLESLRIHEISYTLNNYANCLMMKGDFNNAISSLTSAFRFNESKYVDLVLKNNLMVCYTITNNPLYEKYFYELENFLYENDGCEIDLSINLKIKYSLGFVQDYFVNQNSKLKNFSDCYCKSAIDEALSYDQETLPYLWFKDWKDDVEKDIKLRLGNKYTTFNNYRFEPWLVTITHD